MNFVGGLDGQSVSSVKTANVSIEICLLIRLLSCHPTILQYLTAEFTTSA